MQFCVRRIAGVLLIALTLLGACNGGGDDQARPTDSPGTDSTDETDTTDSTSPSSTETSVTTTTIDVTVTNPQTGEDFRKLAVELWDVYKQAATVPSLDLLNRAIDPGCVCYQDEVHDIQLLVDKALHYERPGFQIRGIRFDQVKSPRDAMLTAMIWRPEVARVLDAQGNEVESHPVIEPRGLSLGLFKSDDGMWRIGHLVLLDDLEPSVQQQIIELGVP